MSVILNQLFGKLNNWEAFEKDVAEGRLLHLNEGDRSFIVKVAAKVGLVAHAVNQRPLMERFFEAGLNIKAVPLLKSPCNEASFQWLFSLEAVSEPHTTPLQFALGNFTSFPFPVEKITSEELFNLPTQKKAQLISKPPIRRIHEIFEENPEKALTFWKEVLSVSTLPPLHAFFAYISTFPVHPDLVLGVLSDPIVLRHNFFDFKQHYFPHFAKLNLCQMRFRLWVLITGDKGMALMCCALLKTTYLKDAAFLLMVGHYEEQFVQLAKGKYRHVLRYLIDHIKSLENAEERSIWKEMFIFSSLESVRFLIRLGFPPPPDLLFHSVPWYDVRSVLQITGIDPHLRNQSGHNALDHHCYHPPRELRQLGELLEGGLSLSDDFEPALQQKAKKLLPDDPVAQFWFVFYYLHPCEITEAYLPSDLERKKLDRAFKVELEHFQSHGYLIYGIDQEWKDPKGPIYDQLLTLNANNLAIYNVLTADELSQALQLIPESPRASLAIATILKQAKSPGKTLVHPSSLLSRLKQNDSVYFVRYLFQHPEAMQALVKTYLTLKPGDFVHELLQRIEPKWNSPFFPSSAEALKPLERLPLPQEEPEFKDHTLIFRDRAFRFLKPDEEYGRFLYLYLHLKKLELSSPFTTPFEKPLGLYAVRVLPDALMPLGLSEPALVIHLQIAPERFQPLGKLPADYLADAVKFIKMQKDPNIARMNHDHVLNDIRIKRSTSTYPIKPQPFTLKEVTNPRLSPVGLIETHECQGFFNTSFDVMQALASLFHDHTALLAQRGIPPDHKVTFAILAALYTEQPYETWLAYTEQSGIADLPLPHILYALFLPACLTAKLEKPLHYNYSSEYYFP